jgi:acetyl-CoA C-acetyltransferase
VFCAAGTARELGIPETRWIFPVANAESNHMLELCRRPELHRCRGAEVSGAAAFEHAGIGPADLDLVELYSCFPVAVQSYARELGIDPSRDLTVTGGMPFAGGPFNNYVLQATCRMAELLRERPGTGLVTTVSGVLTKQAVTIWSSEPGPRPFANLDVTGEVAAKTEPRTAVEDFAGPGAVVAVTVLHTGETPRVVALVEDASGVRGFGHSERPDLVESVEREAWVGRTVQVGPGGEIATG